MEVAPRTDLKITNSGGVWKVTDLTGNQFFFEASESGSSSDNGDVNLRESSNGATFYLSKIITKNGRQILFRYQAYFYSFNQESQLRSIINAPSMSNCPRGGPQSKLFWELQYLLLISIYSCA
ncbi:hypothetical protein HHL16_13250 [Pseudoflavitalea sp. G-6-1-2]|uniref:hypothetical protein n=1 Tax=Pseudoflavitalea sp. G-6-1-2 TaxID=2728841 RepID=UPI00146EFB3A|nr:hypothetical protein [Pseudoflavitalea sp. G-6-1-2]NML21851.1 hypothetical protein [Pseudoflavitalea sp. G-6-1-2]